VRRSSSKKDWIFIISATLILHIAFFTLFKPHYFTIFKTQLPRSIGYTSFRDIENGFSYVPIEEHDAAVPDREFDRIIDEPEESLITVLDMIGEPSDEGMTIIKGAGADREGESGEHVKSIMPKPLFMPWPEYPDDIEISEVGIVELLVLVNKSGEVDRVELINGLPQKSLNNSAVEAAYRMRFSPGIRNGSPTRMWVRLSVGFQPR